MARYLGRPSSRAADLAAVVFLSEPGACAGRLAPGQTLIPDGLARTIDYHVWPSTSSFAVSARARTVCEHIDYEMVWRERPEIFARRNHVGAPPLPDLWEAKGMLAESGVPLAFDVQFEDIDGQLALAIYGAGVVGRIDDELWREAANLLTTCASTIHEPRFDVDIFSNLLRPARPPAVSGWRRAGLETQPEHWEIGDWHHTWWCYPIHGGLRRGCACPAHHGSSFEVFGPMGPNY